MFTKSKCNTFGLRGREDVVKRFMFDDLDKSLDNIRMGNGSYAKYVGQGPREGCHIVVYVYDMSDLSSFRDLSCVGGEEGKVAFVGLKNSANVNAKCGLVADMLARSKNAANITAPAGSGRETLRSIDVESPRAYKMAFQRVTRGLCYLVVGGEWREKASIMGMIGECAPKGRSRGNYGRGREVRIVKDATGEYKLGFTFVHGADEVDGLLLEYHGGHHTVIIVYDSDQETSFCKAVSALEGAPVMRNIVLVGLVNGVSSVVSSRLAREVGGKLGATSFHEVIERDARRLTDELIELGEEAFGLIPENRRSARLKALSENERQT